MVLASRIRSAMRVALPKEPLDCTRWNSILFADLNIETVGAKDIQQLDAASQILTLPMQESFPIAVNVGMQLLVFDLLETPATRTRQSS